MERKAQPYSYYLLAILFTVYIFNFIDRQILSILSEEIKASLGIDDAQIGFLYGTAFAVFYAIFGIPLGKLADTWQRRYVIAIGLGFWSLMTALSGTAKNFGTLAAYRIGVGVGEASATPAALSMIADSFPARMRGMAMALYSSGIYVGGGIGIFIGGYVLDAWEGAYPQGVGAPFGLLGWQAAFLLVGVPGLLMTILVATLREPKRGDMDGISTPESTNPFRESFKELTAILPGVTLFQLHKNGATAKDYINNGLAFVGMLILGGYLIYATGDIVQWIALGIGLYAAIGWMQVTRLRDPIVFELIFKTPSLVFGITGFAVIAFVTYSVGFWAAPFFLRVHDMSATDVGLVIGWSSAIGGLIGVIFGGWLSDFLNSKYSAGRLHVGILTSVVALPCCFALFLFENTTAALVMVFFFNVLASIWIAASFSFVSDMTLPRMRAVASALNIMTITFIGLALGPYSIGRMSVAFGDEPMALGYANVTGSLILALSIILLLFASRRVHEDKENLLKRAAALGEPIS